MIEVEDLEFTYRGAAKPAVRGVSFDVADQEIFGFLGPSGAGKSTTQKILIGLLTGYRGRVQVLGRETAAWGADYYENIGVQFELPNHHQRLTALENLEYFGGLYRGPIVPPREVLGWVGLEDAADQRVAEFSKGMKIRLNLARSLLHKPKLLFLDEPTGGLDPINAKHVKALVRRLRDEGTTVFLTTHDMAVAEQICDRVAFITAGNIAVIDAPEALKRRHGQRIVRVTYEGDHGDETTADFPLDGLGEDEAFRAVLTRPIRAIHSQETSLDEVFIEVTGERLAP